MNVIFSARAGQVLDDMEKDPRDADRLAAVWQVVEFVAEHPGSAEARRRALWTPAGHAVWMVPIPGRWDGERWFLLWQLRGEDVLIPYIGPEDFRAARN